jgi:hypothetical protein
MIILKTKEGPSKSARSKNRQKRRVPDEFPI